eukprot:scaffold161645_cov27-Tisochrysis_lutea.AAC.2
MVVPLSNFNREAVPSASQSPFPLLSCARPAIRSAYREGEKGEPAREWVVSHDLAARASTIHARLDVADPTSLPHTHTFRALESMRQSNRYPRSATAIVDSARGPAFSLACFRDVVLFVFARNVYYSGNLM